MITYKKGNQVYRVQVGTPLETLLKEKGFKPKAKPKAKRVKTVNKK